MPVFARTNKLGHPRSPPMGCAGLRRGWAGPYATPVPCFPFSRSATRPRSQDDTMSANLPGPTQPLQPGPPPRTSGTAVAALTVAIGSYLVCPLIGAVIALVL